MNNPLSHKDFSESRFKPHGSVAVWPEGSVVYLELTGPFNREFFSSLLVLNNALYAGLKDRGTFVEIATFKHSMLMSLDAITEFGAILLERKHSGRAPLATAWVIDPDVDDAFVILPAAERKFREAERPFKVFEAMAGAQAWVRGFLVEA